MGITRQFALRAALYMLATLAGIIGSLILVRKLEPEEYAYYQGLTKRAFQIGWLPFAATSILIFRWLAKGVSRSINLFVFQTLLATITLVLASLAWAMLNGATFILTMTSITLLVLLGLWSALRHMADAWRPVKVSVVIIFTRVTQTFTIVLFVYLMAWGLFGAIVATVLSLLVGVSYFASILRKYAMNKISEESLHLKKFLRKGLTEYFDIIKKYAKPSILSSLNYFILGLDVFIATSLKGLVFTAPFLAFQSVMGLLQDTLGWASRIFQRNLITGESSFEETLRTLHLTILAATPLYLLAAYHPTHVAMLLNPAYAQYPELLTILSLSTLMVLIQVVTINTLLGTMPVGNNMEKNYLTQIYMRITIVYIMYITLLLLALTLINSQTTALLAWSLLHLTQAILITILSTNLMKPHMKTKYTRTMIKALAKSSLISIAILYLTEPLIPPPNPIFWDELANIIPMSATYLSTYTLIALLADKEARSILTKLPTLIKNHSNHK